MITVTDLSDNQFAVDVPLISSVFRRGPYTELKLGTGQTFYIQESVGYVMRLVFRERQMTVHRKFTNKYKNFANL